MTKHLCNLLVPGAAKSGTSSLHQLLDQHPKISMSTKKEPHYFAIDARLKEGLVVIIAYSWNSKCNEGHLYRESSPLYMLSEKGIERVKKHLSSPQVIFFLRHPFSRCISHYDRSIRLSHEARPPRVAFEENGYAFDPNQEWGGNFKSYLQFSNHSRYIPMWQSEFGKNVPLIRSEALRYNHRQVMKKCFSFLDVKITMLNKYKRTRQKVRSELSPVNG